MKITLDSTILVRAFEDSGGLARDLLFTILDGNHTLVLSSEILAETSRVLRYPRMRERHGMSDTRIYEYVMFLQSVAPMVQPDPVLIAPIRDANDIVVLQTAVAGGASGGLADAPRQSAELTRISSPLPSRHFCNQSIFWYSQIRNC